MLALNPSAALNIADGTPMAKMENHTKDDRIHLQFFDQHAVIADDSQIYTQLFQKMYPRFQVEADGQPSSNHLEFSIRTQTNGISGKPFLRLDNQILPLRYPDKMEGYLYDIILNTIVSRVKSHFLIHAGVVSKKDRGILLVADSGHGKTTLVLELVRRGFHFLSDEMAALGRADRRVHPFPRSLRIRPRTLDLTGFHEAGRNATTWMNKLLLDIEDIKAGSLGKAVPIHKIIILQDPRHPDKDRAVKFGEKVAVKVDRADASLVQSIRKMDNVTHVDIDVDSDFPWIVIQTGKAAAVLTAIEALCKKNNTLLLNVMRKEETRPAFNKAPFLKPLSTSQAALILLRRFLGSNQSSLLLDEFKDNSLKLYMGLAELIGHAECHRLYVGPLKDMADIVCGLADKGGTHP